MLSQQTNKQIASKKQKRRLRLKKTFTYDITNTTQLFTGTRGSQDVTVNGFRITCSDANYETGAYPYRIKIYQNATFTIESVHDEGKRGIKEVQLWYQSGNKYQHYFQAINGSLVDDFPTIYEVWTPYPSEDKTFTSAQLRLLEGWLDGKNITLNKIVVKYYEMQMDVDVSNYTGEYDGNVHSPNITVSDPTSNYTIKYSNDGGSTYTLDEPVGTDTVGEHTVYFKVTSPLYVTYKSNAKVTITKATPTYKTTPTVKTDLVANGSAQALVNAGSSDYGTVVYRLNETGEFSETIPSGTDAGTYTVEFKILSNNEDYVVSPVTKVQVTIATVPAPVPPEPGPEPTPSDNNGGIPGWAIALIVVGGLLAICCLFLLVLFIFFPRYIVDYSAKKVIRVIYVKKHYDMVLTLDTHLRKVRRNEADVYKTRSEAEAALKK